MSKNTTNRGGTSSSSIGLVCAYKIIVKNTKTNTHGNVPLGEVVAAAFDGAGAYSDNPREVSLLATLAIAAMLGPRARSGRSRPLQKVHPLSARSA